MDEQLTPPAPCAAGEATDGLPEGANAAPPPRAADHVGRARAFRARGELDRAVAELTEAVRIDPRHAEALLARGEVFAELGEHELAVADYTAALDLTVSAALDSANQVLTYTAQNDFDRAVAQAARSQEWNRSLARCYVLRGDALDACGALDRALADFTQAIARDPAGGAAFRRRGETYSRVGEYDRAVDDFTEALRRDPADAAAHVGRGLALQKQGKVEPAVADFSAAARLRPSDPLAYHLRAAAHLQAGDHGRAAADAGRAIDLDPYLARAYLTRSMARAGAGDYGGALADFARALELEPGNHFAHEHPGLARELRAAYHRAVAELTRFQRVFRAALVEFADAPPLEYTPPPVPSAVEEGSPPPEAAAAAEDREPAPAWSERRGLPPPSEDRRGKPGGSPQTAGASPAARYRRPPSAHAPAEPAHDEPDRGAANAPPADPAEAEALEELNRPTPAPAAEAAASATAAEAAAATLRTAVPVGKLQVQCPECGTAGLLDTRNLGKLFRCPACSTWCRTTSAGQLTQVPPPEGDAIEVEVRGGAGGWSKDRVPLSAAGAGKPPRAPARPSRGAGLADVAAWLGAAARTRAGRWGLAAGLLLVVASAAFAVSPLLFPSALRWRGEQVARAWLRQDAETIRRFTEPGEEAHLALWLAKGPPPELAGPGAAPTVTVESDDGRAAEILIQLRGQDRAGKPVHYVFRHRWVYKEGSWYFRPPATVTARPPAGPAGRPGRGRP